MNGWADNMDCEQTYRVVGVRSDGARITIVRAATKETAEKIVDLLTAEKAFESLEIEPEDDRSSE